MHLVHVYMYMYMYVCMYVCSLRTVIKRVTYLMGLFDNNINLQSLQQSSSSRRRQIHSNTSEIGAGMYVSMYMSVIYEYKYTSV